MKKEQVVSSAWDLERSITHMLHRASQVAEERFGKSLPTGDITPRQFSVLAAVARDPNVSQTDLVRLTGVDRSTLADIVRRLVKNGLLHRRRTRADARAYAIRLTPDAITFLEQACDNAARAEQALLESFSRQDRENLIELLRRLVDAAGQHGGDREASGYTAPTATEGARS